MAEIVATLYPKGLLALPADALPGSKWANCYRIGDPYEILVVGRYLESSLVDAIPYPVRNAKTGERVVDLRSYLHLWSKRAWPTAPLRCHAVASQARAVYRVLVGEALGLECSEPKPEPEGEGVPKTQGGPRSARA